MNRITWSMGQYNTQRGKFGDIELFSLTTLTHRPEQWDLRIQLPGMVKARTASSEEAAKEIAEDILTKWLSRLFAGTEVNRFAVEDLGHDMWLDEPKTERDYHRWLWRAYCRGRSDAGRITDLEAGKRGDYGSVEG